MKTLTAVLRPRRGAVLPLILLALAVGLAGCKGATKIKTLLDDPGRYDGQVVRVGGTVVTSVGLLGYGGYKLDDGTGSVLVVTKHGVPREGAKVGVEGTFHSVFTFHDQGGAAIEETTRYEP